MAGRCSLRGLLGFGFLLVAVAALAATRSIRVDDGGGWTAGSLGTAACPGTSSQGRLVLSMGWTFSGQSDPQYLFNTNAYCQRSVPFNPQSPGAPYFSENSFFGDELALASFVGLNQDNAVSAIRYSYLDDDLFNNPDGFQWAFFSFPHDVTFVELYGLDGTPMTDAHSYIIGPGTIVWRGGTNGYDGEYFCFRRSAPAQTLHQFVGTWDGVLPNNGNACLGLLDIQFTSGFE